MTSPNGVKRSVEQGLSTSFSLTEYVPLTKPVTQVDEWLVESTNTTQSSSSFFQCQYPRQINPDGKSREGMNDRKHELHSLGTSCL